MEDPNEAPGLGAEAGEGPAVQCGGKIAHVLVKWKVKREKSLLEKVKLLTNWGFLLTVLWVCWDWRQNCENYFSSWITLNVKIHVCLSLTFALYFIIDHCMSNGWPGPCPVLWKLLKKTLKLMFPCCVDGIRSYKSVYQSEQIANGIIKNETGQIFMTLEGYAVLMEYFNRKLVYKIEDVFKTFSNLIVTSYMGYFVLAAEADVYWEIWRFVTSVLKVGFIDWATFQGIVTFFKVFIMCWAIFKFVVAIINWYAAASNAKAADEQCNCFLKGNEGKKLEGSLEPIVASSIAIEDETSV